MKDSVVRFGLIVTVLGIDPISIDVDHRTYRLTRRSGLYDADVEDEFCTTTEMIVV